MKRSILIVISIILIGVFVVALNPSKKKKVPHDQSVGNSSESTVGKNLATNVTTNLATKTRAHRDSDPSKPVLAMMFEKEKVMPFNPTNDKLQVTLSSGEKVDIPLQYESGGDSDRYARIISDPTKEGNHILHYWLKNATIPTGGKGDYAYKGRIQTNFYDVQYTSAHARYRMYLHPDINFYKSYPDENTWFTVSELWFRNAEGNNFRITLGLGKEKGQNKPLYFVVSGDVGKSDRSGKDGKWENIWGEANTKFEVPVGEWIDMKISYKQGDKDSGRLYLMAKRPSDPEMLTVFDITNWTYNPNASIPTPLTGWNPLKLYTSGKILKYIRDNGGVAQIYWDDFEFFDHWSN